MGNIWRLFVAWAWLDSLKRITSEEEKTCWRQLFQEDDFQIVQAAARKATELGAVWAVEPMLERISTQHESTTAQDLRQAVKEILHV